MPNHLSNLQIPSPTNWQDFETLCWDLWRSIWNDPNAQKNGREGQKQYGVDIYGRPNLGSEWAGVQVKEKDNLLKKNLTEKELIVEVDKARLFKPKLSQFIIATTGPKDAKLEQIARTITDKHISEGSFSVSVYGWTDILLLLQDYPLVFRNHFQFVADEFGSLDNDIIRSVRAILDEFEAPNCKISSVVRKAIRIAQIYEDYENLWWLEYEMISFRDEEARRRIFNEMSLHLPNHKLDKIEKRILEAYINERTCLGLDESGNIVNKQEVEGRSILGLENFVDHFLKEIENEKSYIDRKASLSALVANYREILKRIEQRVYTFLASTESKLMKEKAVRNKSSI